MSFCFLISQRVNVDFEQQNFFAEVNILSVKVKKVKTIQ